MKISNCLAKLAKFFGDMSPRKPVENYRFLSLGLALSGEKSMAKSYAAIDGDQFLRHLKSEVDFLRREKSRDQIVVIDAGANLGFYAIGYHLCGSAAVHALEPYPSTYRSLSKNIAENRLQNIYAYEAGLYFETVEMQIGAPVAFSFYKIKDRILKYADKNQAGCKSIYTKDHDAKTAKFYAGDEFLQQQSIERVDLIKIDVEGAEYDVIRGLTKTLRKCHPLLRIEINHNALKASNVNQLQMIELLISLGYQHFCICPLQQDGVWQPLEQFVEIIGAKDVIFY
jgi:FkbM family methyltransferase